jgi:hypothetical protein
MKNLAGLHLNQQKLGTVRLAVYRIRYLFVLIPYFAQLRAEENGIPSD